MTGCTRQVTYGYSIDDVTATWTAVEKADPVNEPDNLRNFNKCVGLLHSIQKNPSSVTYNVH